ncbi:hypothetical protein EDD21DRAFT_368142 [Dissophora ornata]|nr:hypothetical protein EDD21DRAFT_368142 [Dissophora ornata]
MMLESIGMVRPKVDGFFAYRGPVETTNEDPDSSDAGPRSRKPAKRKSAAGSSPLSTGKGGASKSAKGSNLAVMENANDSTSELSEMDDKPKTTKSSSASSGLANSSTLNDAPVASGGVESGMSSAAMTPTKKKTVPSKSKAAVKDVNKDGAETGKDSDKESKAGLNKKAKAKPTKAATSSATVATTPVVRVDSPPPLDDNGDNSTTPPPPSRSSSPSRLKSKPKAATTTEVGSTATASTSENMEVQTSTSVALETASPTNEPSKASTKSSTTQSEGTSKSKGPKTLEPLNDEVQAAYNTVADLAKEETWEVKTRFPVHIKAPLFACARIALATRSSGYVLDDSFFFHLQAVLPYNKFTLKKLIYKNVLPGWIIELEAQKTRLIEQVTTRANMIWKASGLADLEKNQPEKDGDGDVNMNSEEGKPQRKFPWSQDLRLLLWETMEKFMEILAAKQELHAVDENQPPAPTDSKTRKDAYQTLLLSFPPGWMTSYEISRQYSQLKEKVQKQEKRGETESSSSTAPVGKPRPMFSGNGPKSGSTGAAVRSASTQSSGTSSTDKRPAPTTDSSTTTLVTSPITAATSAHPSHVDAPKESLQRSSPSMSPSAVSRVAHLSEIVHPTPMASHAQYAGSISGSIGNRKRKKPEEAIQSHGAGSSHDPVVIAESHQYDDEPMNPPGYRSNSGVSAPSSSYHQGSRELMYQSRHPPSPPPLSHSSHPSARGYAPPSPQQMRQHPSQYHEPPPRPLHLHVSPGGSPYGSSTHPSPSRPPPPPSQSTSTTKAMSMSNLLHHPHTSQQQQQHSR